MPFRFPLAILAAVAFAAPASASAAKLTISPQPGTPDASPQTQISVLGVAPSRIQSVTATGSASGAHAGVLRPYSRGRGASFVPAQAFAEDERVDAVVTIRGRAPVRFSFTIAHFAGPLPLLNPGGRQPEKLQSFVSRPDLQPPRITVRRRSPRLTGGIFITPLPSPVVHPGSNNTVTINPVGPGGPMIIDGRGELVWFQQLELPNVAANLRVQRFAGRRVLTWWQGGVTPFAFGIGEGVIADTSYRTLRTVKAGNGYPMDIHEFELTPEGDALFTIYSPIMVDLPGPPEGRQLLMDAIVQQVDVRTGLVVWEWHGLGHIPLAQSYATPQNSISYDAYHFNSIQQLPGGRVLVSARDTSAIYLVDQSSGRILWTLGGKASTFRLGRGARFWFQHDARMLPNGQISMFDDEAGPPQKAPSSRGLILALDHRRRTARVARQYLRFPGNNSAQSEGNLQKLPGGNVFVGWGSRPYFSEFTAGGRILFDASLPEDDGSYRIYRFPWSATPRTRPDAAARRTGPSRVSVYASWNGATTVRRWQVLAGSDAASLAPVATATRTGFETRIDVSGAATTFAVRALSSRGRTLATSAPVAAQ